MAESNPVNTLIGRSLAGAFAGAIFGSLAHVIFFWERPPAGEIKLPWTGAMIGALLVGILSVVVGGRELPNWFRHLAVGFLAGVVIGVLAGAFAFAPLMAALELGDDTLFYGKALAVYQQIGIALGAPIGGIVGLLVGVAMWLHKREPA